jgi:protocatechuate 3,4-dioxygenase alpha subunit
MTAVAAQTVGPFFGFALPYPGGADLVPLSDPRAVVLSGRVVDGAGAGVPDALLELWQADADGRVVQRAGSLRRDGFTFTGWGRAATDNAGCYRFVTVRPGPVGGSVPFIAMTVFARGLLNRLFTRVYLPGTAHDAVLAALPEERRRTLIASEVDGRLQFDVHLQGPDETVFLQFPGVDE